jgi:hypothetical protein
MSKEEIHDCGYDECPMIIGPQDEISKSLCNARQKQQRLDRMEYFCDSEMKKIIKATYMLKRKYIHLKKDGELNEEIACPILTALLELKHILNIFVDENHRSEMLDHMREWELYDSNIAEMAFERLEEWVNKNA